MNPTPKLADKAKILSFQEIRKMVLEKTLFKNILRFSHVQLKTYQLENLQRPLITSTLLRLLSRNRCEIIDRSGNTTPVSFTRLLFLLIDFIKDYFAIPSLLRKTRSEIRGIQTSKKNQNSPLKLNLTKTPVYLRTDSIFDLPAGGSISHIAGVFNNLCQFSGNPLIVTTQAIPLIRPELSCKIINPGKSFNNFTELPQLYLNHFISNQRNHLLSNIAISFIYQRYSLHNYSGVKLANHYKVPLVVEYNGSEVWMGQHWTKGLKYSALAEEIENLNTKAADMVVVVSQPLKTHLVKNGVDPEKILVNPNGVDPERYAPVKDKSEVKKKFNLENKTVIGFIGTFGKWHGAEILARAYGMLIKTYPDYRRTTQLLMIGDGVTLPLVKNEIEYFNTADNVTLTGTVPQEEGPMYLAACDLLASPHVPNPDGTPFFGSPTKLFEYMAMGAGIIASDLDQIGEVLQHDHTAWLVEPGDPESLMLGLKAMIDTPETNQRLGEAARREVVAKYTWKEHTRKIIEKLKERCP